MELDNPLWYYLAEVKAGPPNNSSLSNKESWNDYKHYLLNLMDQDLKDLALQTETSPEFLNNSIVKNVNANNEKICPKMNWSFKYFDESISPDTCAKQPGDVEINYKETTNFIRDQRQYCDFTNKNYRTGMRGGAEGDETTPRTDAVINFDTLLESGFKPSGLTFTKYKATCSNEYSCIFFGTPQRSLLLPMMSPKAMYEIFGLEEITTPAINLNRLNDTSCKDKGVGIQLIARNVYNNLNDVVFKAGDYIINVEGNQNGALKTLQTGEFLNPVTKQFLRRMTSMKRNLFTIKKTDFPMATKDVCNDLKLFGSDEKDIKIFAGLVTFLQWAFGNGNIEQSTEEISKFVLYKWEAIKQIHRVEEFLEEFNFVDTSTQSKIPGPLFNFIRGLDFQTAKYHGLSLPPNVRIESNLSIVAIRDICDGDYLSTGLQLSDEYYQQYKNYIQPHDEILKPQKPFNQNILYPTDSRFRTPTSNQKTIEQAISCGSVSW